MPAPLPHTRYPIAASGGTPLKAVVLDTRSFLFRYVRIWRKAAVLNFSILATNQLDFITFILAKLLRMGFFFFFVISVFSPNTRVAGYTPQEAFLFFAFMNLIDVLLQLFYRGLTDHPRIVKNGDLDFILTKPVNPLFYCTFRVFDLLDLITLPIAFAFIGYGLWQWGGNINIINTSLTALFVILGFIIALSLNIIIAALSFWTTEITNAHWIYRDFVYVARFPPEVFPTIIRLALTYLIPIFVIVSFPTKALLHRLSPFEIIWAFLITIITVISALAIWNKGIKHYTSASS